MFSPRLEGAARQIGFQVVFIESGDIFSSKEPTPPYVQFAEHTIGPGAILVDRVSAWQPALLIFDLNNQQVPWRDWIALLKSAPATRRTPIICFGSHKDTGAIRAARDAGVDAFFARSRFVQDLPGVLTKYARKTGWEELIDSCSAPLSGMAIKGIELFNQGMYFEAHEWLEEAWIEDRSPGRELYRAVLQVAVAYLQIQRQNYTGAVKMFLRLRQWIDPLPDYCRGVDVRKLHQDALAVYDQLTSLGNLNISEFDQSYFKPLVYQL